MPMVAAWDDEADVVPPAGVAGIVEAADVVATFVLVPRVKLRRRHNLILSPLCHPTSYLLIPIVSRVHF